MEIYPYYHIYNYPAYNRCFYSHSSGLYNNKPDSPFKIAQEFIYIGKDKLLYQATFSFGLGILLAPLSAGLFILVLFILLFEMFYFFVVQTFTFEQLIIRMAVITSYIIGWFIGRIIIGDTAPVRLFFEDGFNEIGRPGHYHPSLEYECKNRRAPISTRISMGADMIDYNGLKYIQEPETVDGAIYRPDYINKENFQFCAYEYEQEHEPMMPTESYQKADDMLFNIMRSCHN